MEKLIRKRRSIRRFQQKSVPLELLETFVDVARLAPSAANCQPLEYLIIQKNDFLEPVFRTLKWAGYIRPMGNPPENERPVAYIVVMVNTNIKKKGYDKDVGAAIENLILCALAKGVGTCWISSVDREALKDIIRIPSHYLISDVIAMGYPNEDPVAVDITDDDSIKYYKDDQGRLNVPKRSLENILHYDRYTAKSEPEIEKEEVEENIEWVRVFETSFEEEAVITKGFLESHNIPCVMESSKFHEMPVNFSLMSQTSLLVPHHLQEETSRLIEEREMMEECPHCGELHLKGGLFCPHCRKPTLMSE